jgi:hypothetical protein
MQRRDAGLRALRDHPISQRRVCVLIGVDPKTVRRNRPPDNPEIRKEMNAIAEKRRRFGYRRIGVMLERKGMIMNDKNYIAFTAKKGCLSGAGVPVNAHVAAAHQCLCHSRQTSVGRWILCPIRLVPAESSAF